MLWPKTERTTFWVLCFTSIGCSIIWFAGCVYWPQFASDAGRGGAVGTALALTLFFVNQNYASRFFDMLDVKWPDLQRRIMAKKHLKEGHAPAEPSPLVTRAVEDRLDNLLHAIRSESEVRSAETKFVVAATFIGTIFWGFGDWVACFLTAGHLHCPCS